MNTIPHTSPGFDTQERIDGRAAWRAADSATGHGVLAGLRVLDLSRVLAGPYTAQMLADQGAEVIKVEAPAGDETRGWGPPFVESGTSSAYYGSLNHSKDNICLDLRTEQGLEILAHLIAGADVVVENFKAGTMARWGLDFDTVLSRRHPRLIYCRITGFGVDGPMGGLPGYDAVLQSFGGLMSINGYPDGSPLRVGVPIVDIVTAHLAVTGILLALRELEHSGSGQLVDAALLDGVVSMLHPHAANWIVGGSVPQRTGDFHPTVVPYQVFHAADGDFFVSAANDRQFRSLTQVLGVPELADDARFTSNALRYAHRDELVALLGERIALRSRAELAAQLEAAGVAASAVNTVDEALQSAQARHRELFIEAPDYRGVGVPISLSRSPHRRPRPAVARGADTTLVLTAMGYPAEQVESWRSAGIFGNP
ncbi:CaiB/BaiF CoA transferase family protein [Nocardia vermiculata]|uniref:CoA transferase n=1 Tax=Nocardia vermiculata TaxID=257274 RepID=A0A846YCG9_9NOCA|nr:CoA transferase [Nocardia vermiculata]NKY54499.1 CoA transferase [Nocardia vermiculata]